MTISVSEQVKHTFGLAAMNREAKLNLTGDEWAQYNHLTETFEKAELDLIRTYKREYKTRVETARKRLIDKAGSKRKQFKHRLFGYDQFDNAAITRQAIREVEYEHQQDLKLLKAQEHDAKEAFISRCEHRIALKVKVSQDFQLTTDRRDGYDRRQAPSRKRKR